MLKMSSILKEFATLLLALVEILLIFRFVLKLFSASQSAPFVRWIYQNSEPLLQPFQYAFPSPTVEGGFVIEFTTLFALFVYAFVGHLLQYVLDSLGTATKKKK